MTVTDTTNEKFSHLLPDRHPQRELFVCDVADAVLKDIMQHMEHPFYSLSKKTGYRHSPLRTQRQLASCLLNYAS